MAGSFGAGLLAALIRSEFEALELLRQLAATSALDALRPRLSQYVRLHEGALLRFEALRQAHFPNVVAEPSFPVDDGVIVVTEADIVAEG